MLKLKVEKEKESEFHIHQEASNELTLLVGTASLN